MKQKGFANIILIVVIVAIVAVGGYFALRKPTTEPIPLLTPANNISQNNTRWDKSRTPTFEDFPVGSIYKGTYAQVDFSSHPLATQYKTKLEEAVKRGPNFAGHYAVASFGCGTSCLNSLIVDIFTGKVYDGIGTAGGNPSYQVNSELIFDPEPHYSYVGISDPDNPKVSKQYFVINGSGLKMIYEKLCTLKPMDARLKSFAPNDLRRVSERIVCED